jgi:hypothetical protein
MLDLSEDSERPMHERIVDYLNGLSHKGKHYMQAARILRDQAIEQGHAAILAAWLDLRTRFGLNDPDRDHYGVIAKLQSGIAAA